MFFYTLTVIYHIFHIHVGGPIPVLRKVLKLNENQTSILEKSLAVSCYPNKTTIKALALQTGLRKEKLHSYFTYRRKTIGRVRKG